MDAYVSSVTREGVDEWLRSGPMAPIAAPHDWRKHPVDCPACQAGGTTQEHFGSWSMEQEGDAR